MKLVKIVVGILLFMIVLVVIVFTVFLNNLNPLIKEAIEIVGSDTLSTSVTVGSVDIKLKEGKGVIKKIAISNPEGYSANKLAIIDDVGLQIDVESLNKDVKVIKEVYIDGIELLAEQKNIKDTNIQSLLDNMWHNKGSSTSSKVSGDASKQSIRFMIESLRIGESKIQLLSQNLGERIITIPAYSEKNLGSKTKGLSPNEMSALIVSSIMSKAKDAVSQKIKKATGEKLRETLKGKFGKTFELFDKK